jgi:DNA polymerase elongation subunit (family B)
VLIKTKDIVQELGYELVYADTDSVFIKRKSFAIDYSELVETYLQKKPTKLSLYIRYLTAKIPLKY